MRGATGADSANVNPLHSTLPPDARARVDEVTHLIVEKLLLTPTEQLKALGDTETVGAYAEALRRLFALNEQSANDQAEGEADGKAGRVQPFRRPSGGRS